jgi:hypothetical protein
MNEFLQLVLMTSIPVAVGVGLYYATARTTVLNHRNGAANRATQTYAQNEAKRENDDNAIRALKKEVEFWMSQYQLTLFELEQAKLGIVKAAIPSQNDNPVDGEFSILAIWPVQGNLNLQASRDALYNAGVTYVALTGIVTMVDVIDEFSRNSFNALELGTHGKHLEVAGHGLDGGILLSDGIASPGWWARLATFQKLQLAVLLACDSLQTGEALLYAGVEHVVAVQGAIEDAAAIKFALSFYKYIAAGKSIATAFDLAKLALPRDQVDKLRLLVRKRSS